METKDIFLNLFSLGKEFKTNGHLFLSENTTTQPSQPLDLPVLAMSLVENRVPFSWREGWIVLHEEVVKLGSAKSGFHGHRGRPGRRGGSAPRGLGISGMGTGIPADVTNFDAGHTKEDFAGKRHIDGDTESQSALEASRGEVKADLISKLSAESGLPEEDVNKFIEQWAHTSNDNSYASLHVQEMAAREFGTKLSDWQKEKLVGFDGDKLQKFVSLGKEMEKIEAVNLIKQKQIGENYYAGKITADQRLLALRNERSQMNRDLNDIRAKMDVLGQRPRTQQLPIMSNADTQKALRAMYNITQQTLKSEGIETVRLYRGVELPEGVDRQVYKLNTNVPINHNTMSSWTSDYDTAGTFGTLVVAMDVPVSRILSTARTGFGALIESEFVVIGAPNDQVRVVQNSIFEESQ